MQVPVGGSLEEAQVQAVRELGCLEEAAVQVPVGVSSGEEVLRSGVVVRAVVWVQAACLGAVRESAAREARLFLVRFMCMLTCIACERRVYVRARRKQGQPRTRDSLSPCR